MSRFTQLAFGVCRKVIKYDDLIQENISLKEKITSLEEQVSFGWPNGHFYSPVHSLEDLKYFDKVVKKSQAEFTKSIPGFSEKRMIDEFNSLKKYFREFPFPEEDDGKNRFYQKNPAISLMDGLVLYSMMRLKTPKRIIEIGSGYTSALMMDVNDRLFDGKIKITFVEPYPENLLSRMKKGDKSKYKIIKKGVQFVSTDIFKTLKKNDILFIDSTHVSKFNSDVNYELFNILPILNSGVIIHFHDILDGFEYPLYWLEKGWAWNEAYLLRAYLTGNKDYNVLLMTNYLTNRQPELLKKSYPKGDVLNGGDLWIQKK